MGILPDSTATLRTKLFHTRTQFDGASTKHAPEWSYSRLNGVSMLSKPPRQDVVALLDHESGRKRPSPLLLSTPQRGCELEGRRGERKRRSRAGGGQESWVGVPEWLSAVGTEPTRAQWSGWPMWPNLQYARAHESKVARVFRAGLGKCGACAGVPNPR